MDLKDILEMVMEHAVESVIFLLLLSLLSNIFLEGGLTQLIGVLGGSIFGY